MNVTAYMSVIRNEDEVELHLVGEYTPGERPGTKGHIDNWTPGSGDEYGVEHIYLYDTIERWDGKLTEKEFEEAREAMKEAFEDAVEAAEEAAAEAKAESMIDDAADDYYDNLRNDPYGM